MKADRIIADIKRREASGLTIFGKITTRLKRELEKRGCSVEEFLGITDIRLRRR